MNGKIRIERGVKKIEVNDNGEFIMLPVSDDGFVLSFYRMMEDIQKKGKSLSAEIRDEETVDSLEKIVAVEREVKQKVDALFGGGTCKKVFGDILPSMDLFVEFFGSLVPFLEEYQSERKPKMEKYNAGRTGSAV